MHQRRQLFNPLQSIGCQVGFLRDQPDHAPEKCEVLSFAWEPRRILLEKRNDLLSQFQSIAHLKPITEAVVGTAVTLNVDFTAPEESPQIVENRSIHRSQFQTEARFDFRPTPVGPSQVNGKAAFTIDQPNHIVGRQHLVSPFGRVTESLAVLWVS
jgi:hypothetical protein